MNGGAPATRTRRPPGRPRRLTLETVIDAACELGDAHVEMTSVAERLGVGVATLYRYVRDRDHLVRLVAARRSRRRRIEDHGQSWQDAVREHAAITFEMYLAWPQLIGHITTASVDDEADASTAEQFVSILVERGFCAQRALDLYFEVNVIVIGAAVACAYRQALETRTGGYESMVRTVGASLGPNELPALKLALQTGGLTATLGDYRELLELLMTARS